MVNLRDITYEDFLSLAASIGEKPYRAGQLYRWVYARGVSSIDDMTDLSLALRERLKESYRIGGPSLVETFSSEDGTIKLLFKLHDGQMIHSVIMPDGERATVCVSTQVGCALGCGFCLTGTGGYERNLTLSEMAGQVLSAREILGEGRYITNIVFMGMGEPLLNLDTLLKFINILTDPAGFALSHNRITVSTAGITPALERLGTETNVNLAVSLNAATDSLRSELMPVNRKYPLGTLLEGLRSYPLRGKKHLTIEYVLLGGVNDGATDARGLIKLLAGLKCKINLIPFNPFRGATFKRPHEEAVERFRDILIRSGYMAVVRKSRGEDIGAACGQLKAKEIAPEGEEKSLEGEGC
ncbi:MAG: 23S rRNA (adenine(2503)-C(2))-methyltransferase RlmN [Thermodesulfobacteriota bacterium]